MIKNRCAALAYRLFCFAFAAFSILAHTGLIRGIVSFRAFMYYTVQSNVLALALFGMLAAKTLQGICRDGRAGPSGYAPRFEMVCVIDLMLTLFAYWALLAPGASSAGAGRGLLAFDNLAVHLVVPLMCLADYVLFSQPGRLRYRDAYYVAIYPLSYVLFSTAAGLLGFVYRVSEADGRAIRFPYFFIDWDVAGAWALLYILALVAFFLAISHLVYWNDRRRKRRAERFAGAKGA